jgi:hypothetical protein
MANFGISVTNNSDSVMITSQYKIMVFSERGTFRIQSKYTDREGSGSVTFLRPILSQEPPQIFLRFVNGVHSDLGVYTTILGGAGNWTGFRMTSAVRRGSSLQNYLMEYVSCKYADRQSTDLYGMNIWDENGTILFSASDRVVRYSKFSKVWTKTAGNTVDIYSSNVTIDADDFVSVSSLDRGVIWFADGASFVGLNLLTKGALTLNISAQRSGGGYDYNQGVAGQNFCIPVCKFPTSRYYN